LQPDPFFSGPGLNRADHLRADPAAIAELASRADARELVWSDGAPVLDELGMLCWQPAAGEPMLFLGFAHKKCADRAAYHSDRYGQRISTHRQPADGLRSPTPRANLLQKHLPGQLGSARVKGRGAAIDVVVAATSRSEPELA